MKKWSKDHALKHPNFLGKIPVARILAAESSAFRMWWPFLASTIALLSSAVLCAPAISFFILSKYFAFCFSNEAYRWETSEPWVSHRELSSLLAYWHTLEFFGLFEYVETFIKSQGYAFDENWRRNIVRRIEVLAVWFWELLSLHGEVATMYCDFIIQYATPWWVTHSMDQRNGTQKHLQRQLWAVFTESFLDSSPSTIH